MGIGQRTARQAAAAAGENLLSVTFTGFSEAVPHLYEFHTADGHYVFLHEMDCVNIQFRPTARRLQLSFECVTSEVMKHPSSLTLTFDGARIVYWSDDVAGASDLDSSAAQDRVRGQVSGLSHDRGRFRLDLLDAHMEWEATSVACFVPTETFQTR